ncbi:MAG: hypothetical protein KDC49_21730 [Saprospiraceae bacterium]|nr:hypothetical protein [Saprospiraceae bacterium]
MGLLNLFKKKNANIPTQASSQNESGKEPYYGDLKKTDILHRLVRVPKEDRNEEWQQRFLENVSEASFRCGEPQVIVGPDGFPYFQLFLPEPNKAFQCFVISHLKNDCLLDAGIGVVINPGSEDADWVFSYGDILNFHLNQTFYTNEGSLFSKKTESEVLSVAEEVLVAQPSEKLLPDFVRKLLADFLKRNGINKPRIALMMRNQEDEIGVTQDLVFNVTQADFQNEDTYHYVMQAIAWHLPRHYSFIGLDEKILGDGFASLYKNPE